jgi:arylsulfatase A-like enzyme
MYDPEDMQPGSLVPGEHERNPLHFQLTQDAQGREKLNELYWEDHSMHGFHSHLSDEQWRKKSMAIYYGMTSFMDQQIGRILEALDRTGQAQNTLVVFSTDHGHFLGQHGLVAKGPFHYEDMIRIPFIVRWPGKTPTGQVSQAIQNLVDLPQSFLAAAGLEEPAEMAGVNQTETWTGAGEARNWSITENRHTFKNVHLRTYVNQRYKITVYRSLDEGELFDLQEDPRELNNLWSDPSAVELKASLLKEFLQATMSCEPAPMPRIAGA